MRLEDIATWEKKTGLRISAGDALLLRTKRPGGGAAKVRDGYDPAVIPLLKERDVALLGADIAQEGGEIPGVTLPMHYFTLVALGMNLLDNLARGTIWRSTSSRTPRANSSGGSSSS